MDEKFKRFKNRYIDKERRQFKTVTLGQLKDNIQYELDGFDELNINNWEKVFWMSLKNSDICLNLIVNKLIITYFKSFYLSIDLYILYQ